MADFQGLELVDGVLTRIRPKKAKTLLAMIEGDLNTNERPLILAESFSYKPRFHWLMLTDARILLMNKGTVILQEVPTSSTQMESTGDDTGSLILTTGGDELVEIPMRGGDHHANVECAEREGLSDAVGDRQSSLDAYSPHLTEPPDRSDAVDMGSLTPGAGEMENQSVEGSRRMDQELVDLRGLLNRGVLSPDEYHSAVDRLVANFPSDDVAQPAKGDLTGKSDRDDPPMSDAQPDATGNLGSQDSNPWSVPSVAGNEQVLLDEQGYTVTPSRLFVPPDKVFNLSQVVSCDLKRSTNRVPVRESRDESAGAYAVMAAVVFGIGLAVSDFADGWLFSVALVMSIWLLTKTRKQIVYDERTTSWLMVAYSNRSEQEVLVTDDNQFAKRLHAAIVQAIGRE